MRFITIATNDYAVHLRRLVKSLKLQHPTSDITVYCEDSSLEAALTALGARIHVLPEIRLLGVKRAKFTAYAHAASLGGFVYLDADILVIRPLDALVNVERFTACRDDLAECPYVPSPASPWEHDPELPGDEYFNSGVFAAPAGFSKFFATACRDAVSDDEWHRFTIPGKLYDNHFLCAKIKQHRIPVDLVSEYEYNWQGFRRLSDLNCYVDSAGELRCRQTGSLLRLVHFAGVKDIEAYIAGLPLEITQILAMAIGEGEGGVLELINSAVHTQVGLERRLKVILARSMVAAQTNPMINPGAERPLLAEPASVSSIALSTVETDFRWNGLKCGAAYLSASEYKRLRDFVAEMGIESVLEFGAGYTSALFAKLVRKQVALEGWDGPWLEFARDQGADARLVPFSEDTGFNEIALAQAVDVVFSVPGRKLVFIDSPPGTANRKVVVEQVLKDARSADFYVVHDSVRDSSIVYRLSSELGLQVIDHFHSLRGLTFLGKPGGSVIQHNSGKVVSLRERVARMRFEVDAIDCAVNDEGQARKVLINLVNTGKENISAASDGLGFSVHLADVHDQVISWDTPRYTLPVDLAPADCISFWVEVPTALVGRTWALFDFVREGDFWWSELAEVPCPKLSFA